MGKLSEELSLKKRSVTDQKFYQLYFPPTKKLRNATGTFTFHQRSDGQNNEKDLNRNLNRHWQ